ncbi:MAG: LLM class flavin-dependent oxidoreductase [Ardenticatenaceae bacterium]|nr:LLM class flavin-dependent oxidoreductase [Ardenticatenaceae bacterium]MCB8987312.1 LLM class flavin-dependent oxidoreductase [Ardenticatenaceae bacterium]
MISIAFQTNKPLRDYGPLAQQAETYGFDVVTVYNDMLYQPAWLPLLEMARHTHRVRLGPTAVNPFTCHPINMAGNIALLDEASNGRAYLGIARGAWLDFVGLNPPHPIAALREALACVRHLLHQSTEPLPGDYFSLAGGDSLRWTIHRPDIPILLGTWGARTITACRDMVQEVKLGGSANPNVVAWLRATINRPEVGIVLGAVTVVAEDGRAARDLARREVALYLPVVAELDPTLTLDPELVAGLKTAVQSYDFGRAAGYISDDLLARFAFAGTPRDVIAQADAIFAAGADRVEFGTPHGLSTQAGLELLGKEVLPHITQPAANGK